MDIGISVGPAQKEPEALSPHIEVRVFSARWLVLFNRLEPEEIADYLAAAIIGSEIDEALAETENRGMSAFSVTRLSPNLIVALALCGGASPIASSDAAWGLSCRCTRALIIRRLGAMKMLVNMFTDRLGDEAFDRILLVRQCPLTSIPPACWDKWSYFAPVDVANCASVVDTGTIETQINAYGYAILGTTGLEVSRPRRNSNA